MKKNPENESASTELQRLENEILELQQKMAEKKAELIRLQAREDLGKGVFFPQEIHCLKQESLQLKFEMDIRTQRMKRIDRQN